MDIEELREHLGEELYTQVSEKLSGVDGLRVISTTNGMWIPKAKFDEERRSVKERTTREMQTQIDTLTHEASEREREYEQRLAALNTTSDEKLAEERAASEDARQKLQAEIDRLTTAVQEKETELSTVKTDLTAKTGTIAELTQTIAERDGTISSLNREAKERRMIRNSGARDEEVVLKLLDQGRVSEGEDGALVGVQEQIDELKKTSGYLFTRDHPQRGGFPGGKEQSKVQQPATADVNAAIRAAFGR